MPSCPVKTKDWSWADSTYFWILGLGVSERAKVPLHERLNDLSAVKTRFKNSSVPLQQYRIHQRRIINLQNIIQSPPKPLNCMLQLIEVLIQLLELLGNFLLNRSLDGEKSKAQQKMDNTHYFLIVQWYRKKPHSAPLMHVRMHTQTHTYLPRHSTLTQPWSHHVSSGFESYTVYGKEYDLWIPAGLNSCLNSSTQ